MTARAVLIGALAETPIHPGTGQTGGAIDLPVAREGGAGYPFVPGSSSKGSTKQRTGADEDFFGTAEKQGRMMFGDFRLLLLPLRSSHGAYKWATCPHLLERLSRDINYAIQSSPFAKPPSPPPGKVYSNDANATRLLLEEMAFAVTGSLQTSPLDKVIKTIKRFIPAEAPYTATRERISKQLLLMSNDDFAWFARFGLPVQAHNKLKKETKASENLWYEETLPPDTLMYSIVAPRMAERGADAKTALDGVLKKLEEDPWIQFGGNETTGQGICRLHLYREQPDAAH